MKENEEIKDDERKKRSLIIIIFIVLLLFIVVGVAYALFSMTTFSSENSIKTGSITMSYTEPTSAMSITNALPMGDTEGKTQTEYFEFNISSHATTKANDSVGITIPYEINITTISVESPMLQLQNSDIKIYLTEMITGDEVERIAPIKINALTASTLQVGAIKVYSTSDVHKNASTSKVRTYRLRAWIANDFDSSVLGEDIYEYRFTVNVKAQVNAL